MGKKQNFNGGRGMNLAEQICAREQAKYDARMQLQTDFLLQIGGDAFLMTCADLFDLQPGRAVEAVNTYRDYINALMDHIIDDAKDDPEITYFWGDLDRRIAQIVGKDAFVPKEERYDETGENVMRGLLLRYAARLKARELDRRTKNGD